jgi:hypothetical protein
MKVEIGTEAAQFLEKEYINGIFLAVCVAGKIFAYIISPKRVNQMPAKAKIVLHFLFYGCTMQW